MLQPATLSILLKNMSPFGQRVGHGPDQRREQHIKQRKDRNQRSALPVGRLVLAQQLDRRHKQRVIRQRREELRRHDGVETALHFFQLGCR